MRKKYPSDITRGQFEHIRGILESGKKKTAPRKVDLYEIFCAILYLLKSGCQWRMLPETFPKWKTVFTICAVMSAAKVMIHSGMISDIAKLLAGTGAFYPFVSPLIGVLGAFITGSGTSTSVLFGNLQQETALSLSLSQYWIAAANLMGAGIGKMVCPQCIAIGTGAVNAQGCESKILSKVFKYFLLYALLSGAVCFIGAKLGIGRTA